MTVDTVWLCGSSPVEGGIMALLLVACSCSLGVPCVLELRSGSIYVAV